VIFNIVTLVFCLGVILFFFNTAGPASCFLKGFRSGSGGAYYSAGKLLLQLAAVAGWAVG